MEKYNKEELDLLNIQLGCVLRLTRLKQGLSQYKLSLEVNTDPTMIGRIERFENATAWDKIYLISQYFDLDFCKLFYLKEKGDLLTIIEECQNLEKKLTKKKEAYYKTLRTTTIKKYNLIHGK